MGKGYTEIQSPFPWMKAYSKDKQRIMVGKEDGLWHMSISHDSRLPTWDEVKKARYTLMPRNITVAMLLPPPEEYVNVHEYCFHLHEIKGGAKS